MLVNLDNAKRYLWGENCDGWHLLKSDSLSIIHERMPPGTQEARHFHNKSQQFFFVLEGEATLELDGMEFIIRSREGVHVPAGSSPVGGKQDEVKLSSLSQDVTIRTSVMR